MTKPWQIWLVLIAIFGTGVAGGWLVERHIVRRQPQLPPPPEVWVARQIERVASEVDLTPEQKEHIKPIIAARMEELFKLRRQAIDILDQMGKQIAAELTPEQRTKYERILRERREARRQAQEMHNARHRGEGAPGDGREPAPEPGDRPPPPPPPAEKSAGT
jgi:hypothetical protein